METTKPEVPAEVEQAIATLIRWAGDDPDREGLLETPDRVVRSYEEFFRGYNEDPREMLQRTFEEVEGYDEVVMLRDIRLESHCEHHMVPIIGRAHVAYLPEGRVVGISKLARLVEALGPMLAEGDGWRRPLADGIVYLAAAVLAVPLAKLLGLGSVIGYLAAGIVIGPFGLGLVSDPSAMLHFAEFGVVLMLFLVGLELEPRRLWALRQPIFGWGGAQLIGSSLLIMGLAVLMGAPWRLALVGALALAMSSTAIGLAVLNERNLMSTTAGQSVLSVALLQDIAAIPILAVVPLLAAGGGAHDGGGWLGVLTWAVVLPLLAHALAARTMRLSANRKDIQ